MKSIPHAEVFRRCGSAVPKSVLPLHLMILQRTLRYQQNTRRHIFGESRFGELQPRYNNPTAVSSHLRGNVTSSFVVVLPFLARLLHIHVTVTFIIPATSRDLRWPPHLLLSLRTPSAPLSFIGQYLCDREILHHFLSVAPQTARSRGCARVR